MQTLSPQIDRLGAALKALRQTAEPGAAGERALGVKCLAVVIDHLTEEGLPQEALAPLVALQAAGQRRSSAQTEERRKRRPPSEALLARVTAVIDLLVKAGYDENEAAQAIMRRLIAVGVSPPVDGGDARGWRRLLSWRSRLLHGLASQEAKEAYEEFNRRIDAIPPSARVRTVLDDHLWDLRRKPGST